MYLFRRNSLIVFILFFSFLSNALLFPVYGTVLSEKEAELDDLRVKLESERIKYEEANNKEVELSTQLRENQALFYEAQEKVRDGAILLEEITDELKRLKRELLTREEEYANQQNDLEVRLQNMYENTESSCVFALMEAKSLTDFINTLYYLQMLVADDLKLLKHLNEEKTEIGNRKAIVEERYNEALKLKKELNEKEGMLAAVVSQKEYLLSLVVLDRECSEDRIYLLEHNTKEVEDQIQGIISGEVSYKSYAPASFNSQGSLSIWPTNGPITSDFGWRMHPIWGDWRFHSGVDIGADYGEPIYAAGDGVIITCDWLGGYGNTVMIDHGGGMVSLYGHCSSLSVSYGQVVKKGEIVAYVGSTGNSTGPHLHFEVRQNGVSVDPYCFVN